MAYFQVVGMTGFEPATTRPPDEHSTGLSYIPKCGCKYNGNILIWQQDEEKYLQKTDFGS